MWFIIVMLCVQVLRVCVFIFYSTLITGAYFLSLLLVVRALKCNQRRRDP